MKSESSNARFSCFCPGGIISTDGRGAFASTHHVPPSPDLLSTRPTMMPPPMMPPPMTPPEDNWPLAIGLIVPFAIFMCCTICFCCSMVESAPDGDSDKKGIAYAISMQVVACCSCITISLCIALFVAGIVNRGGTASDVMICTAGVALGLLLCCCVGASCIVLSKDEDVGVSGHCGFLLGSLSLFGGGILYVLCYPCMLCRRRKELQRRRTLEREQGAPVTGTAGAVQGPVVVRSAELNSVNVDVAEKAATPSTFGGLYPSHLAPQPAVAE